MPIADLSGAVVPADRTSKLVDTSSGIQIIKGGQAADEKFVDSIIKSYTNLVNNPIAMITLIFLVFAIIAENGAIEGPIEALADLINKQLTIEHPGWKKVIFNFLASSVKILINNKIELLGIGLMWVPYMVKPSGNNLFVSSFATVLVWLMADWSLIDIFVLSQLYFLFVSIRNPTYRVLIVGIAVFVFFVGVELGSTRIGPSKSTPPVKVVPASASGGRITTPRTVSTTPEK